MSLDKYTKDYERGRIKRLVDKIRAERGGRQFTYGEIDDSSLATRDLILFRIRLPKPKTNKENTCIYVSTFNSSIVRNMPKYLLNGNKIFSMPFTTGYMKSGNNCRIETPPLTKYRNGV